MTTDQQLIDAIRPLVEAAHAIDKRISCAVVNVDLSTKKPFIGFHGDFSPSALRPESNYGVEEMLKRVKPFDPRAEKLAAIEKLKAELAALESKPTTTAESAD